MTNFTIFAVLGLVVCPVAYIALCWRMRMSGINRPPYIPFFFVFGTAGGWMVALALSPSGLTALSVIFLGTLAPLALIGSSIYLLVRSNRSKYDHIALWSGLTYLVMFVVWMTMVTVR